MILILTQPRDEHANHVAHRLEERGADFVRFDAAQFPSQAQLSLSYSATGQVKYLLYGDGEQVDLTQLTSVWYRRPDSPVPHATLADQASRTFVEQECKTFVNDLWNGLDCLWLPAPPTVVQQAQLKASHLRVAARQGFELPPTLITNSPEDFLAFYRQHNGQIISKLAGFAFFRTVGMTFSRYTELISKRDVGYAQAVRFCPMIFQAYVSKRLELRITVVGQEIFAAEIDSQTSNHTRYDWRRYDHYATRYAPHALPDDVAQRCLRLVKRLGLCYGAIDMILTPDGRYVFLEINPNGQYLWIEEATGLPISDAICDLLISGTPVFRPVETAYDFERGESWIAL